MNRTDAVFNAESALRKHAGVWAKSEIRLFGRLSTGSLAIGDTVSIPIIGGGRVESTIARFSEDLTDDWLGLPFYDAVNADLNPFCLCIDGAPFGQHTISIPSQIKRVSMDDADAG